jgi:Helix-hairpin-helix motif
MRHTVKWFGLLLCLVAVQCSLQAQIPETSNTEQQVENLTENNEDTETEDDSYLQQMEQYIKNPLNLNYADETALKELKVLSPLQISSLMAYRNLLGRFISIYELQAVPGWDIETIQKIRLYITVAEAADIAASIAERLSGGGHSLLLRGVQVLEQSKGYLLDSSTATNFYPGSPQKIFIRYRYNYKNLLQYGLVAEKDAGEQFFKGAQPQGFDFYSAHFFVRNIGVVKALALGDFTVNMGQGLTQWQSLAFKKSPDVINIKRQAAILRPYNSAGEIYFHRGAGITLAKGKWQTTLFASYRKMDANLVVDTLPAGDDFVSSLQTSGFHRTKSEAADKGVQRQLAFGGNISWRHQNLHAGFNTIQYQFNLPITKSADPYNLFALNGKSFGNYSFDYSYTYKNLHVFGEAAVNNRFKQAIVSGMLISVSAAVDMSFLYRNISREYQSLYANAFTESTFPNNEKGMYGGITIRPATAWRIDAYADFYRFPWLKFRVDAPSSGTDYLVQATYKPNKVFEVYTRFRAESKAINFNPEELTLPPVIGKPRQNWRTQFSYRLNTAVTLRSRAEMVWYDKRGDAPEQGFLLYGDILYKPMLQPFSAGIRLQYFETEGYNSRLYAYENDILYSFSIPVFFDKGYRYYINMNYDINRKLSVWVRFAQTIFKDKSLIGSGLDEIQGTRRSELKLQLQYIF